MFQSMPMYINSIADGKQFPDQRQSFMMKRDNLKPNLNQLEKVNEIQNDIEKHLLIFYHAEDVKPFLYECGSFTTKGDQISVGSLQFDKDVEGERKDKKQDKMDLALNQIQNEQEYNWFTGGWRQPFITKCAKPNYDDINRVMEEDEDENKWDSETKSLLSWHMDQNGGDDMIMDALDLATIPMNAPLVTICPLELIEGRWMFQSMPMHMNLMIYGKQFSNEFRSFYDLDLLRTETEKQKNKDEKQDENEPFSTNNSNKIITLRTISESVNSGNQKKTRRSKSKQTKTIARGLKAVLRSVIF